MRVSAADCSGVPEEVLEYVLGVNEINSLVCAILIEIGRYGFFTNAGVDCL